MQGVKRKLKHWILPQGRAPRVIHGGLLAGLTMELDLQHQSQRWLGLQERELYRWFRQMSIGIRSAADVGANDGMYSLYFMARTPATRVVAVEPDEGCRSLLRRNLALNGLSEDRLELVPKFAGNINDSEHVVMDSFTSILEPPCLVKVDIDGGEVDLLRGAQRLLQQRDVRWIIEVHSAQLESDCARLLRQEGYSTIVVPNAWWRVFLPELRHGELNRWLVAVKSGSQ